jgi:Brp/Blh family beta-carotene 15,15'-monooxygenase
MNIERVQGRVFVSLAMLAIALPVRAEPPLAAMLILVFGVPHGAFDPLYIARLYRPRGFVHWSAFTLLYAAAAVAVVGMWRMHAGVFLGGFLLLSVWHFAGDPGAPAGLVTRVLHGGAIIVLPALLHAGEVTALLAMLVAPSDASFLVEGLHRLAPAWLTGLVLAAGMQWRRDFGLETLALVLLAVFAHPLIAFTVFFCAMHGARHLVRTQRWLQLRVDERRLYAAGVTMLALLPALVVAWYALGGAPPQTRAVQLLFVGLAALTVPHMAVVESARALMAESAA